jgi:hypothetical protein
MATLVGVENINAPADVLAIRTLDNLFILPGTPAALHLEKWLRNIDESSKLELQVGALFNLTVINACFSNGARISDAERFVARMLSRWDYLGRNFDLAAVANIQDLTQLVATSDWTVFAPSKWSRKWKDEQD